MQTKVQNMQNYYGYTKCGEILRPPAESYQRPYVLKCFTCKEIHLLLEAFIFHIEDHCKGEITREEPHTSAKGFSDTIQNNNDVDEQMELGDRIGVTDVNVKVEENNYGMQTVDPLIVIKPEYFSDEEFSSVKDESKIPDSKITNKINEVNSEVNNSSLVKEVCETDDSMENVDKIMGEDSDCSYDEIENTSDNSVSCDDDDDYEIVKKSKNEWECTRGQLPYITEFLKSKKHVMALIEAYKNQPSLWNKNFPFLRHKLKRQNCLQQIAQELNTQHNMDITWNQVANIVVFLCRKYREDLKGIKETKEDEKKYISSWFFEDLNFLKPFMENNPIAKLDSHLPDLLPDQIIQILEIYKGFPHLWNTELIEHYCKNKTVAAKQEMLQILETKMGLKITEHILEDYFRTINNCFTRAKRNKLDNKPNKKSKVSVTDDNAQEDYYEHMLFLYDHVGFFKCSECERSFKSTLYLKIHQTQVHGAEPPSCSLCQKVFKTVNSYTNHAKRHMEDLNHECKECGKKFLHSNELRIHMRNHTGAKPFCCEICGASFRHIQGFSNHHRRHIKNYLHTCHICSKGFYSKDRYNDHMNAHSNIRSQICNVCGKTFITKRSLQQHVVIHDDVRRHACKLCGKTFKHKTGVNQHMRTHGIANSEEKSTINKE
ncbi:zinc finger protein 140-like [Calliphora vicina]|uniref:zinc finger protein 140-like n=1 Tax=Calliphora vicina TaxID=7373 RepID=UPI00325AEC8D